MEINRDYVFREKNLKKGLFEAKAGEGKTVVQGTVRGHKARAVHDHDGKLFFFHAEAVRESEKREAQERRPRPRKLRGCRGRERGRKRPKRTVGQG